MRSQSIIAILILFIFIHNIGAQNVVDVSQSVKDFDCMKEKGIELVIVRAYKSNGAVDDNTFNTLKAAKKAGLQTDIYHFPCFGKVTAAEQAKAVMDKMQEDGKDLYDTVWIDVEKNPSKGCEWSKDPEKNCAFLAELVKAYQDKGKKVGIYSSKNNWTEIMGGADKCKKFTDLPVWYAHYDDKQNFDDWEKYGFGGWKKPTIKQYAQNQTFCKVTVDFNFKEKEKKNDNANDKDKEKEKEKKDKNENEKNEEEKKKKKDEEQNNDREQNIIGNVRTSGTVEIERATKAKVPVNTEQQKIKGRRTLETCQKENLRGKN